MAQREVEVVEIELKSIALLADLHDAVRWALVLGGIVGERVRWLGVGHAVAASLGACFGAGFLIGEAHLALPLATWCLVHAYEMLRISVAEESLYGYAVVV